MQIIKEFLLFAHKSMQRVMIWYIKDVRLKEGNNMLAEAQGTLKIVCEN